MYAIQNKISWKNNWRIITKINEKISILFKYVYQIKFRENLMNKNRINSFLSNNTIGTYLSAYVYSIYSALFKLEKEKYEEYLL